MPSLLSLLSLLLFNEENNNRTLFLLLLLLELEFRCFDAAKENDNGAFGWMNPVAAAAEAADAAVRLFD